MQEGTERPTFIFTEVPNDPSVSRSTYENEDGTFFLSVHAREQVDNATRYLVNIFNMGDPMEEEGTVYIAPWAQTLCSFAPDWIAADPEVNLVEAAEDAAMNWLDVEDVELGATRHLAFTEDQPEGEERDWPEA